VIEGGVQEEALVGEPERLVGFAEAALTESYELLTFRESANGDSPFFESNWHGKNERKTKAGVGKVSINPRTLNAIQSDRRASPTP
jgi:hypothetical protein